MVSSRRNSRANADPALRQNRLSRASRVGQDSLERTPTSDHAGEITGPERPPGGPPGIGSSGGVALSEVGG